MSSFGGDDLSREFITLSLVMLFFLVGVSVYQYIGGLGYTNYHFDRIVREVGGSFEFIDEGYARRVRVRPVKDVFSDIHRMSHHVVIADEKWGYMALSERNINKLIIEVLASDYDPTLRRDLLAILGRWKAGNFDRAHDDHNYVWEMLGGSIGEAKGFILKGYLPGPGRSGRGNKENRSIDRFVY